MTKHLPLERHREIAPELAAMLPRLVEVASAYPKASTTSRLAIRTFRALAALQMQLCDNAIEENPGEAGLRDVYYPVPDQVAT